MLLCLVPSLPSGAGLSRLLHPSPIVAGRMASCNFALPSVAVWSFPELNKGNQGGVTRTEIRRFWLWVRGKTPAPSGAMSALIYRLYHTQAFCHFRIFSPWVRGNPVWDVRVNIPSLCILPLHSIHCPELLHSLQLYLSRVYTVLHFYHHMVSSLKWWHPTLPSSPKLHM